MLKTKENYVFLGITVTPELKAAIEERAFRTRTPASREIRPILEAEYLPKKKLEDKQKAGKLRK